MSARDDYYVLADYAEGMAHTSPVPQIDEVFDEIDRLRAALDDLQWIIANSRSVVGLRLDGQPMPWDEVLNLYAPSAKVPSGT